MKVIDDISEDFRDPIDEAAVRDLAGDIATELNGLDCEWSKHLAIAVTRMTGLVGTCMAEERDAECAAVVAFLRADGWDSSLELADRIERGEHRR